MRIGKNAALADPDVRRAFEEELLFGETTDTVAALLASLGITQKELAQRLGVSEGRASQILSGGENLTLRSVAALGWALGVRFALAPQPMERVGTPAQYDASPPGWLTRLGSAPAIRYEAIRLPDPDDLRPASVSLRVVDGEMRAA
jgi:transcriptional regulator with XRE-family HTH domain